MKCEEFEAMGLDAGRDASLSDAERAAAVEHVNSCARCAALENSWRAARVELRALAEDTTEAQAPARVEMRLRQEFRTRHHTLKARRTAIVTAWALAAAAVVIGAVSWVKWQGSQQVENPPKPAAIHLQSQEPADSPSAMKAGGVIPNSEKTAQNASAVRRRGTVKKAGRGVLVAENGWSGFSLLPGVFSMDSEYSEILRVRMQRGALESFGLPVNEERASDWIQVDLLVGDDGSPQAVRLPRQQ